MHVQVVQQVLHRCEYTIVLDVFVTLSPHPTTCIRTIRTVKRVAQPNQSMCQRLGLPRHQKIKSNPFNKSTHNARRTRQNLAARNIYGAVAQVRSQEETNTGGVQRKADDITVLQIRSLTLLLNPYKSKEFHQSCSRHVYSRNRQRTGTPPPSHSHLSFSLEQTSQTPALLDPLARIDHYFDYNATDGDHSHKTEKGPTRRRRQALHSPPNSS